MNVEIAGLLSTFCELGLKLALLIQRMIPLEERDRYFSMLEDRLYEVHARIEIFREKAE